MKEEMDFLTRLVHTEEFSGWLGATQKLLEVTAFCEDVKSSPSVWATLVVRARRASSLGRKQKLKHSDTEKI